MRGVALGLLMACAWIGSALGPDDPSSHMTKSPRGPHGFEIDRDAPQLHDERQASAAAPSEVDAGAKPPRAPEHGSDARLLTRILDRFDARHTALNERERSRLARVIVEESRLHDLSPELVMAVIEVESAGYHLAESQVGALGLMQLLPTTARELAEKRGIEWRGPHTLFDPVINVRLGTAYLRELSDRYGGDVEMALAAYNWGPGRIDRRVQRGAALPKRYVEQVRRAADRYATTSPRES